MFATKHDDPNGSLGWGERLSYGVGGFSFNMINGIIGSFLTIYFTSAVGLNAGIIATILAVSKVFDGISDLVMGRIVDKTHHKMGKARIWLLRMCIPFAVTTMLLFFVPQNWPSLAQYIYVFLMYNIVNAVCLTGVLVPFYSLVALETANPYERGLLGNIQQIFQTLGNVVVNSTFVVLLGKFTSSTETLYTQRGFTLTMLVYCAVMVIVCLFCVFNTKERVKEVEKKEISEEEKQKNKENFGVTVKALLKNQYWLLLTLGNFVVFTIIIFYAMGTVFYSQYVLYDMGQYAMLSNAISIAQFAIMFVTPIMMKKISKEKIYTFGMLVMAIGFLGSAMFTSHGILLVSNVLKGLGVGLCGGMALGMVADSVTYGKLKTGVDTVGMGNAGISAAQKIGLGLGQAIFGWVLAGAGLNAALDAQGLPQPESVSIAIKFLYGWVPAIMAGAMFVIMLLFYHCERDIQRLEQNAA
ncbi:MAG: MFS transporter [Oscillospiraceae bacterium]|nr:MFS transporter [Oscillospiraceae bacterium]